MSDEIMQTYLIILCANMYVLDLFCEESIITGMFIVLILQISRISI